MIYVASPYSHPDSLVRQRRYENVERFCAQLCLNGYWPYSPITHCHYMSKRYDLPTDAEWWRRYNATFLRKADALFVLKDEGWNESRGVQYEVNLAVMLDLRREYWYEIDGIFLQEQRSAL